MITAEQLALASQGATTELHRLCMLAERSADALGAAEMRADKAEAALKRARQRQGQLKTAPADLVLASAALLERLDCITTEQFAAGGEKAEREALRTILEATLGEKEIGRREL